MSDSVVRKIIIRISNFGPDDNEKRTVVRRGPFPGNTIGVPKLKCKSISFRIMPGMHSVA